MDGSGHLRFLARIVLPISKAPIFTVLIFGFIGSWNDFLWPLLVTTKDTWRPIMVGLWTLTSEAGRNSTCDGGVGDYDHSHPDSLLHHPTPVY
ncbi:MAG: ABC transporter permease subunit [Caldilineaceae bacterium]